MPVISVYSPSYRRGGATARFSDWGPARMWTVIVEESHKRKEKRPSRDFPLKCVSSRQRSLISRLYYVP